MPVIYCFGYCSHSEFQVSFSTLFILFRVVLAIPAVSGFHTNFRTSLCSLCSVGSNSATFFFFSLFFATFWPAASQTPPSMGFPRQESWSGLPLPPPGDFPKPQIESASPVSPALQADSLPLSHQGSSSIK